jgi:hypothetical protein
VYCFIGFWSLCFAAATVLVTLEMGKGRPVLIVSGMVLALLWLVVPTARIWWIERRRRSVAPQLLPSPIRKELQGFRSRPYDDFAEIA